MHNAEEALACALRVSNNTENDPYLKSVHIKREKIVSSKAFGLKRVNDASPYGKFFAS